MPPAPIWTRLRALSARYGLTTATFSFAYMTFFILHVTSTHYASHAVTGASMSPTLSPDQHTTGRKDHVLIKRNVRYAASPRLEGGDGRPSDLRRGMVVMFATPHDPERLAVKRVVALAGDVVTPVPRSRREGSAYDEFDADSGEATRVTVPWGHVWVEGDNERMTRDSNDYGPVSVSLLTGVATRIVWPRERWGVIGCEGGGWRERCRGRMEWNGLDEGGEVPEEWKMH